jgi:hypothetical protein
MSDDFFDHGAWDARRTGTISPEEVEKLKKSPGGIKVALRALTKPAWSPGLSVPEVKAISNDRQGKRLAKEQQRDLSRIVAETVRTSVLLQSVRVVNTHVVYSADQGQEQMMEILYSHTRHEGMNELVASVISQSLQHMIAQMMAVSESHYKRLMENP